ncbi:MAG TPA: Ig-like domain-containing protein [Solirubrobacteraceae bacterium]|nr:Ig-like domain-containing protein [Solirubrobacteraceae bacterium]
MPAAHTAPLTTLTTVHGSIADATAGRVLYFTPFVEGEEQSLVVRDVATEQDTVVPLPPGATLSKTDEERLIPGGALFMIDAPGAADELVEWRDGQLTNLGEVDGSSIAVAGDYAIWSRGDTLKRRDLTTGLVVTISTAAGNTRNDVAANGDVAYWADDYSVHRWRNGIDTTVATATPDEWATYPDTDGAGIVFRRHTPCCASERTTTFHFWDGTTAALLPDSEVDDDWAAPPHQYRIESGWVAYRGGDWLWTRSPTGTLAAVDGPSPPGAFFTMQALSPHGHVLYWGRADGPALGAAGSPPHPLAPGEDPPELDRAFYENGRMYGIDEGNDGRFSQWVPQEDGALMRIDIDTRITERPPSHTSSDDARFAFTSTAHPASYECRLDEGSWAPCSAPVDHADLDEGPHTFRVDVTDGASGASDPTPAVAEWFVDFTPPGAFALTSPAAGADTTDPTPTLSWQAAPDAGGIGRYDVFLDGSDVADVEPPDTSFTPETPLETQGEHTWHVVAVDRAGHTTASASRTFVFDSVAPAPFSPLAPADGAAVADARPALSWEASSDETSGLVGYDVAIDGGAPSRVAAGTTSFAPASDLAQGGHTWQVTAVDRAGNTRDAPERDFVVDTVPPSAPALSSPDDAAAVGTARPELTWTAATDAGTGVAGYEVWIDDALAGTTGAGATSFTPPADLSEGPHAWRVVARDGSGNTTSSATRSVRVDTTAPQAFALDAPAAGASVGTTRPTLSWSPASDGAGSGIARYEVAIDDVVAGTVGAGATSFTPEAPLAQGPHSWRVRAFDAAGNGRDSETRTVVTDTGAPVAVVRAEPDPVLTGRTVAFDARASSDAHSPLVRHEWDLDGDGTFELDTGASPTATHAYDDPGPVSVGLLVTDAAGNADAGTATLRVTPAPLPGLPGVTINGGDRFTNDPNVTLTARWPHFATRMHVSNDGGFEPAAELPVAAHVAWQLDGSGHDRLPETVYVRFAGGLAGNETYQDDIVLDEAAPLLAAATVQPLRRGHRVRVRAVDRVSGVARMQITANRARPGRRRPYARVTRIASSAAPRWARVIDRAGNRSAWRRLRAAR